MKSLFIPPRSIRRWTGVYPGNFNGVIWKTHNIDLDRLEGKVTLARRLTVVADTTDTNSDTLGRVTAFVRTDADCVDRFWGLSASGNLYKVDSSPTGDWVVDTLANSPTDALDMATFENDTTGDTGRQQLFVTRATDIAVLNDTGGRVWTNSWWVTAQSQAALKATGSHPIEYFPFRRIMIIGDGNLVHTVSRISDTSNELVSNTRLVLPSELQIDHIVCTTNRVWLLCRNNSGVGNGKIVEWDGFSQTFNNIHDAYSATPIAGVNFREVPIILNHKGMILEFNGAGFSPMYRSGQLISFPMIDDPIGYFLTTSIAPRGMTVGADGLIYINANVPNVGNYNQTAGIWCLNPLTGRLYSKYSLGIWGSNDFGQQSPGTTGAIYPVSGLGTSVTEVLPTFLIGGGASVNLVARSQIWTLTDIRSTVASRGYFITQFIPSEEIQDFFDSLWIRFRQFATASNRLVVKAKGVKSLVLGGSSGVRPLDANITWVNTTSFTVTLSASSDALAVGDEVEVLNGDNAGVLAHITAISGNHAAAQTVTIDETVPVNTTNQSLARFDRWKKLGVVSITDRSHANTGIGIQSSFLQLKVELRGPVEEMEISDMVLNYKPSLYNIK